MKSDVAATAANSVLGGKAAKKKISEIRLRRGHAGGYIASNHHDDGDRPHEYPMTSIDDVIKHVKSHMGEEAAEISKEKPKKGKYTPPIKGMNAGDLE